MCVGVCVCVCVYYHTYIHVSRECVFVCINMLRMHVYSVWRPAKRDAAALGSPTTLRRLVRRDRRGFLFSNCCLQPPTRAVESSWRHTLYMQTSYHSNRHKWIISRTHSAGAFCLDNFRKTLRRVWTMCFQGLKGGGQRICCLRLPPAPFFFLKSTKYGTSCGCFENRPAFDDWPLTSENFK